MIEEKHDNNIFINTTPPNLEVESKPSPEEFSKFLTFLPQIPTLIPIIKHGKKPEIPKGESWKSKKYHLTPEQALNRLK
ncbi:MAG: hypothetical protein ACXACP_02905 [Candidatus Hodarchaeales archaeon]|jgi:hypothetical protein